MQVSIVRVVPISGATHVRALVEVDCAGFRLRGLKLEMRNGRLQLGMPGRKIQGSWQTVVELQDPDLRERLTLEAAALLDGRRVAA